MHREKYYSSKIPLPLVLLFLLNVFLVVVFQLLVSYKLPAKADASVFAKYNPAWAGCTILSQDSYSIDLHTYLLEFPDGSRQLVTTKPHSIVFGRAKIVDTQVVEPHEAEQIFYIKNAVHTSEIAVLDGNTVDIRWGYGGSMVENNVLYLILGAAMGGIELLIYYFIKKNL